MRTNEGEPVTLTAPRTTEQQQVTTPSVFISYRHEDTAAWAAHVGGLLRVDLGIENVFVDSEDLWPGEELPVELEGRIRRSDVTLVLIGQLFDGADGAAPLAAEDDWVRRQIRLALAARHDVVPVVFGGADMPSSLPDDIALLDDLHRIDVNRQEFEHCYQSILTAVWYHLEHRPGRLLVVGDDDEGIDQSIADFVSSTNELDWAEPRTRQSRATRGLQVLNVERYADYWPDVLAIDRALGSETLESRICGLAHPETIVRVRPRLSAV